MISTATEELAEILLLCNALYGSTVGKAHVSVGIEPHLNAAGKYAHKSLIPTVFEWPSEAEQFAREIQRESSTADVYLCPYLMHGGKRAKGAAVERRIVHCDYDGDIDLGKVRELGGFAVASGTPGHAQVYVPLTEPVTAAQHQTLCKALGRHLGGDADSKISDNDLMRPTGTWNHKPTVDGREPAAVEWLIRPEGQRIEPEALAKLLKAHIGPSLAPGATNGQTGSNHTIDGLEPFTTALFPKVVAALANPKTRDDGSTDRSATIAAVIGACYDSHLTLANARWVIDADEVLRSKVEERRVKGHDDVITVWLKIADSRQEKLRNRNWFASTAADEPATAPARFGDVAHLEQDFWDRPSLRLIHSAAKTRHVSPWAVFGVTAAYALHLIPPGWTLPPLIGGKGSLNWYVALCAVSGGGKNAAAAVAEELIGSNPLNPLVIRNLGSGEGIVNAYWIKGGKGEPDIQRPAIHFSVAEVKMLQALSNRNGSTLIENLLDAFSGGKLGFSYAASNASGGKGLATHGYRLTMNVGVQPGNAGILLDDSDSGTPQRFFWFPAKDVYAEKYPAQRWDGQPLELGEVRAQTRYSNRDLTVPEEVADFILTENVKDQRGELDALDGHATFCREKLAYALAVLDNRVEMTEEDWRLSGIAAEVSAFVRAQVGDEMRRGKREQARRAGSLRGEAQAAADNEKQIVQSQIASVLAWLTTQLGAAEGKRMKKRDLQTKTWGMKRDHFAAALDLGQAQGKIRLLEDGVTWELISE